MPSARFPHASVGLFGEFDGRLAFRPAAGRRPFRRNANLAAKPEAGFAVSQAHIRPIFGNLQSSLIRCSLLRF